ncbi:hypothetical protein [Dyadobacter arcticus]|uniref:DUF4386 domain-containing protein n=1 Tax=Dyadobacter arcticus TaxID=1078754 RepID=A0ABX0UIH6_9BACT|nr:hypothetical protein [Dyadobacter arcticus]NIJ52736.1 hypothetical protein [Dyadobacter arcticus]
METTIRHKGPHLGLLATLFMLLFITGLCFVISLTGVPPYYPGPWESASTILQYFHNQRDDVLMCAFFQFCSAIPLGIFTASVVSRMGFLGSNAAGKHIALFGGFTAAVNLILSSFLLWVMTVPELSAYDQVIHTLYYLVFIIGGVGYSVLLGLLIAGIAVTSLFMKTLPKWMAIAGIILALVGELSCLSMIFPKLLPLIPLIRFPGFIWLVLVGFKMPKSAR